MPGRLCVLALSAAMLAAPAFAQSVPPEIATDDENVIIVTGNPEPPSRSEIFDQALELSRVDPGRMYEETLARFTAPVCVQVSGLGADLAAEMARRLRGNAAGLGLRLARGRCTPNLIVAFVDNGQSLFADIAADHPRIFSRIAADELAEIATDEAPVRVWNVVETKSASGAALPYRRGRQELPSVRGRANQMFLPTRKDIDFALVVYDREAVLGMTVTQLADYATMRGLAHTRAASGDEPMNTILALFDETHGDDPAEREPAQLTDFDIAYLQSVYFWRADRAVPAVGRLLSVRRRANNLDED